MTAFLILFALVVWGTACFLAGMEVAKVEVGRNAIKNGPTMEQWIDWYSNFCRQLKTANWSSNEPTSPGN